MAPHPDLQAAVQRLPRDHAAVLRGLLSGFDVAELAALASVPDEAVVPLVQVAVAKLGRAIDDVVR